MSWSSTSVSSDHESLAGAIVQVPVGLHRRGAFFRIGGSGLFCAALFAAPLLAGTVHRHPMAVVLSAVLLALASTLTGETLRGQTLLGARQSHLFLLFVLAALIQVLPLPIALRGIFDPAGNELLTNGPRGLPRWWPASLDPRATTREVGTAVAALAAFVLAFHASATGRRHTVIVKAVAVSGAAGLVIAILHHLFDVKGLYGRFADMRQTIPGPFINANHSAEFFELTAFAALSLALATRREVRIAWGGLALLLGAAALATLSRGSVIALTAGGLVFAACAHGEGDEDRAPAPLGRLRKAASWTLGGAGLVVALALALGAGPVADEISRTALTGPREKPALWMDSLAVIRHHPGGIGRHAFEHVFPVYKTLPVNATYSFAENAPLQLLIDVGWFGFAALVVSFAVVVIQYRRRRRADGPETALVAGLGAVLAHNMFDFGLELFGLRLLFAAIAGIVIGGALTKDQASVAPSRRGGLLLGGTVLAAGCVGLVGLWHNTAMEYVAQWQKTRDRDQRRQLVVNARSSCPTDHYLAVLQAADEPLRAPAGPSPKLAALNQALRLCPRCPDVHRETARALFLAGLRSQSVASWRDVLRLEPATLFDVLQEMDRRHYQSAEIADLAVVAWVDSLRIARHLIPRRAVAEVTGLLATARANRVPETEVNLVAAELAVAIGNHNEARRVAEEARRLAPTDGRPLSLLAAVAFAEGRAEEALTHARAATTLAPTEPKFARQWLDLVITYRKWSDLDLALKNLKAAFRYKGRDVAEVHILAGQAHWAQGNLPRALGEFRTAVILEPANVNAWRALATTTEEEGDYAGSLAALDRLEALSPDDGSAKAARARIMKLRESHERDRMLAPARQ
jgi:tetratricopeptide (TPR) repeat protein